MSGTGGEAPGGAGGEGAPGGAGNAGGGAGGGGGSGEQPFGASGYPDTAGWTPERAQQAIRAHMGEPKSGLVKALTSKTHPGHADALAHWTRIHELAFPEPGGDKAQDVGPPDPPAGATEVNAVVNTHINWHSLEINGAKLNDQDVAAGQQIVSQSIRALDLPRSEAGMMVTLLNNSFRSTTTMDQAMGALTKELGDTRTNATLAEARRVVDFLESKGVPVKQALSESGAGNNPALIKYLASLAPRVINRRK